MLFVSFILIYICTYYVLYKWQNPFKRSNQHNQDFDQTNRIILLKWFIIKGSLVIAFDELSWAKKTQKAGIIIDYISNGSLAINV